MFVFYYEVDLSVCSSFHNCDSFFHTRIAAVAIPAGKDRFNK